MEPKAKFFERIKATLHRPTLLHGFDKSLNDIYTLTLPASKCTDTPASTSFLQIFPDLDISIADTSNSFSCGNTDYSKSVKSELEGHSLPRNQGPLLPILQLMSSGSQNWDEVMKFHSSFQHDPKQKCGRWTPGSRETPVSMYNIYDVGDIEEDWKGPYSEKDTMAVFYTCIFNKCLVGCACNLCINSQFECRQQCRGNPCQDCYPQCKLHRTELDRTFDINLHKFTVVSDDKKSSNYFVKHAGIPKDCLYCSKDLLDHQMFHFLSHQLCKFCLQLMAPILNSEILTSVEDYMKAKVGYSYHTNLTCAFCLKVFDKVIKRKIHEKTVHEGQGRDFKCNNCEKTYTNENALRYHFDAEHDNTPKIACEICLNSFSSKVSLKEHRLSHHKDSEVLSCDQCSATFTTRSNMLRHVKKAHLINVNVNWSLIQSSYDLKFKCDICSKTFSREDSCKRHTRLVHESVSEDLFKCAKCQKSFKLKANCKRHENQCISK